MSETTEGSKPDFVGMYDQTILHPMTRSQYGGSGFYNVGDWSNGAADAKSACEALVGRHISAAHLDAPGLTIVDVGCGLGDSTAQIHKAAQPDADVTGINISEAQLADARQRHPEVRFQQMDASQLTFPESTIDRLIAVESVFHFNTRETFLDSALHVLRPGGLLVMTDVLFTKESDPWDWWVPAANRGLQIEDYANHCAARGFDVAQIEDVTAQTWQAFCADLRAQGRDAAADRIEPWVSHYLFAVLRKPA